MTAETTGAKSRGVSLSGFMHPKFILEFCNAYVSPCEKQEPTKGLEKQELTELDEKFRNIILPHLDGKDPEDYDLLFEWQKFIYDKGQRVRTSDRK
jgi:hypothetical protein